MYNTENKKEEVKFLDEWISEYSSITQLPNGELFCYGEKTLIIDRNYRVRMQPSGTPCNYSSALYFDNNVYCFGGYYLSQINISKRFDLEKSKWAHLAPLPEADYWCHSVIFNGNILISGLSCKNIWLYSVEIDSFSIIPYDFAKNGIKFMINVEKLYLIEWFNGLIYESEDEYHWKPISKAGKFSSDYQFYCLYNKENIYISTWDDYYQFDLKKKVIRKIK